MSQQNLSDHLINVKASLSPTNTRPSELDRLLIETESKSESKSKSPLALAQPPPPSILPDQIKTKTLSNDQIRGWSKTTPPPPPLIPPPPASKNFHPEDDSDSSDDEAEGAILLEAAEHGSISQIRKILKNCEGDPDVVLSENFEGRTSLHLAALESRPIAMQVLLENPHVTAGANRRDMFGCTPLLLLCVKPGSEADKIKCAEQLIAAGALVQIAWTKKMLNRSCLHWCAMHGYGNLSALLVLHPGSSHLSCMRDSHHRLPMDVAGCELQELRYIYLEKGEKGQNDTKMITLIKERDAALRALVGGIHFRKGGPKIRVLQSQIIWGSYLGCVDIVTKALSFGIVRLHEGRETIQFGWSQIYSLEGMTALHFASVMGKDNVIDALVTFHRDHYQEKNGRPAKLMPIPLCTPDHWG